MIEQTDLIVKEWIYIPPANLPGSDKISSQISLDVMKKTASTKKGISCRFTGKFLNGNDTILLYVGEDSYVIDQDDKIDENEILNMIRNSYSRFGEKFDLRKQGTALENKTLIALDEKNIDINAILPLLN